MKALRAGLADLPGTPRGGFTIAAADDFAYTDPVDGSVSEHQGIRVELGRRLADRLPPVGHRHRGRDACESISSGSSPTRRARPPSRQLCWRRSRRRRPRLADIAGILGRSRPDVVA